LTKAKSVNPVLERRGGHRFGHALVDDDHARVVFAAGAVRGLTDVREKEPNDDPDKAQPVPVNAAINGMAADGNAIARSLQSFTNHQQALGTELSLFGNTPVGQIQQQLASLQAEMRAGFRELMDLYAAR
jgi:hypothetical protein